MQAGRKRNLSARDAGGMLVKGKGSTDIFTGAADFRGAGLRGISGDIGSVDTGQGTYALNLLNTFRDNSAHHL